MLRGETVFARVHNLDPVERDGERWLVVDDGRDGLDEKVIKRLAGRRLERRVGAGVVVVCGGELEQDGTVSRNGAAPHDVVTERSPGDGGQEPDRPLLVHPAIGPSRVEERVDVHGYLVDVIPEELCPPHDAPAIGARVYFEEHGVGIAAVAATLGGGELRFARLLSRAGLPWSRHLASATERHSDEQNDECAHEILPEKLASR